MFSRFSWCDEQSWSWLFNGKCQFLAHRIQQPILKLQIRIFFSTLNLSFDMIRRVVKVVFIASSDFPRGLIFPSLLCKNSLWPDQTKQQILRKNNEHAQFIVSKLVAGSHEQDVQYISFLFSGEDKFCMNWIGQS